MIRPEANRKTRDMATSNPPDGQLRSRSSWSRISLALVVLTVIAYALWVSQFNRSPGWNGPVFAAVTVLALVGIVSLTETWGDHKAWLGAAGFVLVALGSGIGRPRNEIMTGIEIGQGDVIGRLDTWTPVIVIGLILSLASLISLLAANRHANREARRALVSLVAVSTGCVVVTLAARDLVVASWIA